jgi:hypothetical protein
MNPTPMPASLPTLVAIPTDAIIVRSSTSAVASLSRLSPSSIVTTRRETPRRFTIEVATASVGLRIAPSATAMAGWMPGITARKKSPSTIELRITSRNDSPAIGPKSRRNSIAGSDTAAE